MLQDMDKSQNPESRQNANATTNSGEHITDIRCFCGRLLAKFNADSTSIQIHCTRCKRKWFIRADFAARRSTPEEE